MVLVLRRICWRDEKQDVTRNNTLKWFGHMERVDDKRLIKGVHMLIEVNEEEEEEEEEGDRGAVYRQWIIRMDEWMDGWSEKIICK